MSKKPILIICNGKSAEQINWEWLKNNKDKIDTFGCNSAYRKFLELDFHPTYYANLDDIVIRSHKQNLQKYLDMNLCQKYFYLRSVPWVNDSDKEFKFKETSNYVPIHKMPITPNFNKTPVVSSLFNEFQSWANTGCDCVQISIMLGYTEIYVIGVDGYIEKVNGSVSIGHVLKIEDDSVNNPNYWFEGYQKKDDYYNIPNADKWHVPSWKSLALLCKDNRKIKIFNMSYNRDYIDDCLPHITYDNFVQKLI